VRGGRGVRLDGAQSGKVGGSGGTNQAFGF
jgi:hypothetical protein